MHILGTQVATPFIDVDDPAEYAVGWRRAAAAACVTWLRQQDGDVFPKAIAAAKDKTLRLDMPGLDARVAGDPFILETVRYLLLMAADDAVAEQAAKLCPMPRLALGWDENEQSLNTKFRMNAMLLANDCPIGTVAAFHNVPPEFIKFYERVCWNVRNDDWTAVSCRAVAMGEAYNHGLSVRQNTPDAQRILVDADRFGYAVMSVRWGVQQLMPDPTNPGALSKALEQVAQADMLSRIATGAALGIDITTVMAQGIEREKLAIEKAAAATAASPTDKLALQLLMLAGPQLTVALRSEAEKLALQESVSSKLSTERKIKATKIDDKGAAAGFTSLDAKIKSHVNDPRQIPLPPQAEELAKANKAAAKKGRAK